MRVPRVFVETPLAGRTDLVLDGAPANHLQRVLRLRPGDEVTLFDGRGGEREGVVRGFERGIVRIALGAARDVERESPLAITLWQAPCRGDRMDHLIEKVTALGVHTIVPWLATRTVVRLEGARAEQRRAHWEAVARAACEQCGRNRVPVIEPPQTLDALIERCPADSAKLVLLTDAHTRARALGTAPASGRVVLVVGPEGGATREEAQTLAHAGFASLSLGPRVLRADTAGAACIAVLQALWGDG